MKITIEQIDKRVADAAAARDRMEEQQRNRAAEREVLVSQAEQAAEIGDADKYFEIMQRIARLDAELHVGEVQLKKAPQIASADEIRAAWDAYAADYNSRLDKGLVALEKAKREFLRLYGELFAAQKAALEIRTKLEQYAGDEHVLDSATPMEFIGYVGGYDPHAIRPNYGSDPDAAYFLAASVESPTDSWKVAEILAVIQRHTLSNL